MDPIIGSRAFMLLLFISGANFAKLQSKCALNDQLDITKATGHELVLNNILDEPNARLFCGPALVIKFSGQNDFLICQWKQKCKCYHTSNGATRGWPLPPLDISWPPHWSRRMRQRIRPFFLLNCL